MYYSGPRIGVWWDELCFCDESRTVKVELCVVSKLCSAHKGNRAQISGAAVCPCLCCGALWL